MNFLTMLSGGLLVILCGFLLCLPLVPLAAVFFMWLWNDASIYLHTNYSITYWQALKLCFFIYVLKGLLTARVNVSTGN